MNVLPTTGCACATCEYLRRTAAAEPTVNLTPSQSTLGKWVAIPGPSEYSVEVAVWRPST